MKLFLSFLISLCKLYIGVRVIWWMISEVLEPKSQNISDIEIFLVFIIVDTWLLSQNFMTEEKKEN